MVLVNPLTIEHPDCPVCGLPSVVIRQIPLSDSFSVDCERCGRYLISDEVGRDSSSIQLIKENKTKISGLIRMFTDTHREKYPTEILTTNILSFSSNPLVPDNDDINTKADLLLEAIRRKTINFGDEVKIILHKSISWAFAESVVELLALLNLLQEDGRVTFSGHSPSEGVTITAKGWQYLKGTDKKIDTRRGFIAIKSDGSADTQKDAIKKAIENNGCKAIYIKDEHFSEIIFNKALGEIKESGFIIVDVTGDNSNVLFEAGFAYGLSRKVIFVCSKARDEDAKFYSKHFKIYFYESTDDLEKQLTSAIKSVI